MKSIPLLLAGLSGLSFATESPVLETPPKGLAASDWSSIRAAYEAGRHAVHRQENGTLTARNPGQQWRTEFDGKGFTVTPDHGQWTWGLELTGYGERTLLSASTSITHDGGKITCQRDENLTEWFINDTRGLEQGWTIHSRSVGVSPTSENLTLTLALRGDLKAQVSTDSSSVSFQTPSGGTALTYGGLKAWDADGKTLLVRFEPAGEDAIRIAVEDQSARYPITIDPIAQQAYLKASNTGASDYFGYSVAVSGDTVVVGARYEDSSTTGVNSTPNESALDSGAAYVFVRSGGMWSQQAYLKASNTLADNFFGHSVAISGNTVVVGAYRQGSASGAAYIFTRSGTTWSQQTYLKASNTQANDVFGENVAVSGDTVVVGAAGEDSNATGVNGNQSDNSLPSAGAAYVFSRSGTTWSQQAYLKASNTGPGDVFGQAVAVSGDTVVIGAVNESSSATGVNGDQLNNSALYSGAAYVFTRSGTTWSQQAYLKASNTGGSDNFGTSLSMSGDTLIVGAQYEDSSTTGVNSTPNEGATASGAAYVFVRSGTTWSQQAYLKASNTGPNDQFGTSVAVSGDTVVVGAIGEDSNAIGIDGNQSDNSASLAGAAYVFTRSGTTWSQQAYLKASNTQTNDVFGEDVAVSGDTVVVGATGEGSNATGVNGDQSDNSAGGSGAAYIIDLNAPGTLPEIAIEQSGSNIANGATKGYGPVVAGTTSDLIFTILNTGTADLTLPGTPKVAVTGSSDFTITAQPASPITGPSGSSNFTVRFAPTGSGLKTASLSIPNNDGDENPYVIQLTGTAATSLVPVSFHLSTAPSAVALQFDIGFTVSGISMGTPVLQGVSSHQISSELLANGKTRFVINSPINATIPPTASIQVMLDPGIAALQDGIMSITGVVATNSSGSPVSASPGAKPIVLNVSPASLTKAVVGTGIPVGAVLVDLDGSITSVLFRLNGSPIGSTSVRPFTSTATSSTAGDFAFTAFFQDNAGNSGVSSPVTLRFIDPSALSTYSAFQTAWLDGAGAFTADPFNTGISNGLAWALGVNPRNPDRSRLPTQFIEENEAGKSLVYRARVLASGVVHQILTSTNLDAGSWSPLPPAQIEETLEAGGWRLIEARVPITEIAPRRFVQLSVHNP